ncbi:MAG TPA: NAD(P)-dependent oxidoreductase [Flavitalea sp.]|nr:NAD(P)-dependent oxidoreductase [Flavitalea sp.]
MKIIGLVREEKIPADNRVALTPAQCKWIQKTTGIRIIVQTSSSRCFSDNEYLQAGIPVQEDLSECDVLLGIKEVAVSKILSGKKYLFFSHTKKQQPHNREMFQAFLQNKVTLIDYECLEHDDGQRILGFGFFAGIVGAHNGMMAYGKRSGKFELSRVFQQKSLRSLIHTYFGLKIPPIKIVITGSGRVAHGILEVMNLMGIIEVDPDEFLQRTFEYPVFTQLKGRDLYEKKTGSSYSREDFHVNPSSYRCLFPPYGRQTDILMNGTYWDPGVPRLFEWSDMEDPSFSIQTIADITDDTGGSIPCNLGDATIENPVYGVDRIMRKKTDPYLRGGIDVMAVGNLPNELPRDASRYFGEQLIKYVLGDLVKGDSIIIKRATMIEAGKITSQYRYLEGYGGI